MKVDTSKIQPIHTTKHYPRLVPAVLGLSSWSTVTLNQEKATMWVRVNNSGLTKKSWDFLLFSVSPKLRPLTKNVTLLWEELFPHGIYWHIWIRTFIAVCQCVCLCGQAVISESRKHSMAHWINDLAVGDGSSWIDLDWLIQEYERERERENITFCLSTAWLQ